MSEIYLTYGGLVSPLGNTLKENVENVLEGKCGIRLVPNAGFEQETLPLAKITDLKGVRYNTLLEQALGELLHTHPSLLTLKTSVIVSSTKGNLEDIDTDAFSSTRRIVAEKIPDSDLTIISNACISGVLAINLGADMLQANDADQVVVVGIDAISDFINFGFKSLFALSDIPCKPFDAKRNGTSLGEACAILVMSKIKPATYSVTYLGGSSSNDANHISGPSRTGEGLFRSVEKTCGRSATNLADIDFISAHGTATVFNDEMESIAFGRLGLDRVPTHSLKGYFGHTLGAAGVLETLMLMKSMELKTHFPSYGFEEIGTSVPLAMVTRKTETPIRLALKTASGFGGGNASLLLKSLEV